MSASAHTTGSMRAVRTQQANAAGPLGVVGVCLFALALIWAVAQLVPAAHLRDAVALRDFTLLSFPHVDALASLMVGLLEPGLFVLWAATLVAVALARGRPRVALAVVAVLSLALLTTETLKPLLAHPHVQVSGVHIRPASWPSGHATAAFALVLCAVLVAPARLRPMVAAAGGAFALAVGCSLLILAWHMPSDVLGGYVVATLWAALAVAALRASERRWPSRQRA